MPIVLFFCVFFGIEGLIVGSFLNVVIDRSPHNRSLGGRSSCDACGRQLTVRELIPVFSFIWQRGKSACCRKTLKWQYPLIEALTGLLFFVTSWFYLVYKSPSDLTISTIISLSALLLIVWATIAIVIIDFKYQFIPDAQQIVIIAGSTLFLWVNYTYRLTDILSGLAVIVCVYYFAESLANFNKNSLIFLGTALMLSMGIFVSFYLGRSYMSIDILQWFDNLGIYCLSIFKLYPFVTRVGEALLVSLPILLLYLFTLGKGMGYGDVKLQFGLGLLLGLGRGFLGLYIGFLVGAIYGVALMVLKKASRKSHIAFGPFLLIGAWVVFWSGDFLFQAMQTYF